MPPTMSRVKLIGGKRYRGEIGHGGSSWRWS